MNNLIKALFILFVMLFSTANSFSQTLEWEKIIGNSGVTEKCEASAKIHSNLYVFGGYYYPNFMNAPMGPHLIFTDASGDTLFTKTYWQYTAGRIYDLVIESDSTIIASGFHLDTVTNLGSTFIFKSDVLGNIIWQQQTRQFYADKIIPVPDGYLVTGISYFHITKLDKLGNLLWQKIIDSTGASRDITLLKDGSYLASGTVRDPNSPSGISSYHKTSPYLVQLHPKGDTIRTKVLGSSTDHDLINAVQQTSDGGLILAGRYAANASNTRLEGLVIKLDSAWNQEWQYTFYPNSGSYNDGCELYNVQETIDSSFIVSGYYRDNIPAPYGDAAGFVAKISNTGGLAWQRQYQVNGVGEWFYDMIYNDDGSAVFSGNKRISSNDEDFYLVKLSNLGLPYKPDYCSSLPVPDFTASLLTNDTVQFSDLSAAGTRYGTISTWEWHLGDGTVSTDSFPRHKYSQTLQQLYNTPVTLVVTNNSGCRDSITLYPFRTLSVNKQLPNVQVQLYPNPAKEQTTITLSGYNQKVELQLLDVTGRKVSVPVQQSLRGESQQLQLNTVSLPKGLYFYRLLSKGEVVATGKLVKE